MSGGLDTVRGRSAIVGVADAVSPTGDLDLTGRALDAANALGDPKDRDETCDVLVYLLSRAGKHGGARVIYFFHSKRIPLFALDLFAKNEKTDLTPSERAVLSKSVTAMLADYRRQR